MKKSCLALALAILGANAQAQSFSRIYFIGDSLSDSGQFGSRFTTNPGQVWAQDLASRLGNEALPSTQGGSDYAAGGARVVVDDKADPTKPVGPTNPVLPSMTTQARHMLAMQGGRLDGQALYSVWGGPNDLFAAALDPFHANEIIAESLIGQATLINRLSQAGARYILVPNIPDLGMAPAFAGSPWLAALASRMSNSYNQNLDLLLSRSPANIIPLNVSNLLHEVMAEPAAYGFSNVTDTACGSVSSRLCTAADLVEPNADQTYLFADGVHPTTAGHRMVADYAQSVLNAPARMAVLAPAANTAGLMQMQHIDRRLQEAGRQQNSALSVWAQGAAVTGSGHGVNTRLDGTGGSWLVGVDQYLDAWTIGAYLSYDNLDGKAEDRHTYAQKRQGGGVYGRWQSADLWVNAQLYYASLDNDTRRRIPLGAASREHRASAGGQQLGGKISAGFQWRASAFTHGPVAGLSVQKARIKRLDEDGKGLSTSMSFNAQDQTSVQSSLGYQVTVPLNPQWTVHASAQWLHEFKKPAQEMGARLQDGVHDNRTFYLPTDQERARNSGLLELNAAAQLNRNWNLGAGVSAQVGKAPNAQTVVYLNTAYRF